MAISKIEEIIEDFRQGKMVILMDDEDRENEGDILMAASMVRPEDINVAVIEGASRRIRPLIMSVASTVLGLMPLLWESGPGADVSARIAAPVVGGLMSCMVLTLIVLPAAYTIWRRAQVKRGTFAASAAPETPA